LVPWRHGKYNNYGNMITKETWFHEDMVNIITMASWKHDHKRNLIPWRYGKYKNHGTMET
jgi:hypothetical protein